MFRNKTRKRTKAVWAVVSFGSGDTDRVTYRCPGHGHQKHGVVPYGHIIWSSDALDWGKDNGTVDHRETTLERSTVVEWVLYKNMGKEE